MLEMLERSLSNVVYRAGFASTRGQARQFVTHGHIRVNDRKVNIPSALVASGDVLAFAGDAPTGVSDRTQRAENRPLPSWLSREGDSVKVIDLPSTASTPQVVDLQRVVEWYAKR